MRAMKSPSTCSDVTAQQMAGRCGAVSAKNLLLSLASENFTRSNTGVSPLKITGRGGPISKTCVFSPGISVLLRHHQRTHPGSGLRAPEIRYSSGQVNGVAGRLAGPETPPKHKRK